MLAELMAVCSVIALAMTNTTPMFVIAEWDPPAPSEGVKGYYLYLGERPAEYVGRLKLDYEVNLHGVPRIAVLNNHAVQSAAVAAYNDRGEESGKAELVWYRAAGFALPPH